MIFMEDSIGIEWRKQSRGRYRVYLFRCRTCLKIFKSRKCYFKNHLGSCSSCCGKDKIKDAGLKIRKRPFEARYNNFIRRTKEETIKTDVSYEDFLEFTKITNCHYCSYSISWEPYTSNTSGFFLDRKQNILGHVKSNLVVCCKLCNFTKRDEFTYEEFKILGQAINKIRSLRND